MLRLPARPPARPPADKSQSFYCGDMAGREGDKEKTDRCEGLRACAFRVHGCGNGA